MWPVVPSTGKSILVVDDETDIRLILSALLTQEGYSVIEAADGQEALDLLAEQTFDLMILDLMMPRVDGEDVLRRLGTKRLKEMPTIVLTAKLRKRVVKEEGLDSICFYVMKPFSNATITELVRCLLGDIGGKEKEEILFHLLK